MRNSSPSLYTYMMLKIFRFHFSCVFGSVNSCVFSIGRYMWIQSACTAHLCSNKTCRLVVYKYTHAIDTQIFVYCVCCAAECGTYKSYVHNSWEKETNDHIAQIEDTLRHCTQTTTTTNEYIEFFLLCLFLSMFLRWFTSPSAFFFRSYDRKRAKKVKTELKKKVTFCILFESSTTQRRCTSKPIVDSNRTYRILSVDHYAYCSFTIQSNCVALLKRHARAK